jgi:hypothetical protein
MSTEKGWLVRAWEASIWHPAAIPPEEWKYRTLKRIWLPVYDVLVMFTGLWAILWGGSPLLRRMLPDDVIQMIGVLLMFVGFAALMGIAFPRFWRIEILAKIALVTLLTSYAASVWIFNLLGDLSSGLVSFIVCLGIPLALFRLQLLGEEIKERREDENEGDRRDD